MGYRCPVCGTVEADGEHLANHLAFTALTRGGDHGAWLDEHVPDWADRDPPGLATAVIEYATETDHEPTTAPVEEPARPERAGTAPDEAVARVLDEARELTESMREPQDE